MLAVIALTVIFSYGLSFFAVDFFLAFLTCLIYSGAAFIFVMLKKRRKVSESNFYLGELLLAVLFTATIVFAKMYSDGNVYAYTFMGIDTINAYIPLHMFYSEGLRDGGLDLWNAEFGYGGSFVLGTYDPLRVCMDLLTAVLGRGFLLHGLVIHKIGCLLISAYFCYKFLCLFSDEYSIAAIASYLYAFNGYGNIWGQHYHFAAYPMFAIAVFYGVERFLYREGKVDPFMVIISGICIASSVYSCYMIYFSAAIYALIRYVYMSKKFQIKKFISKFSFLLANILIGFGTGMLFALPFIGTILSSDRVRADGIFQRISAAVNLNFFEPWWDMPRRMLTGLQTYQHVQYYEDQQLFFSVISVVFLLQFLFAIHKIYKYSRQRICVYLSVVLVLFSVYNGLASLILYAFAEVEVYRALYVLFPVAALMVFTVLDNIFNKKIFNYEAAVFGGIISVSALLYPYVETNVDTVLKCKEILPMCIICCALSICLLISSYRSKSIMTTIILCIVLVFNCTVEFNAVIADQFDIMSESDYKGRESNGEETCALLNYVRSVDDGYYRIDKTYCDFSVVTDSLFENYRGCTLYKSSDVSGMKKFYSEYLDDRYSHSEIKKMYYLDPYQLVQYSMVGLRYVLSIYEPYDTDHFIPVKEYNGRTLYRLSDSDSFGTFYTRAVSYDEFSGLGYADKSKVLQNSVILEEDFTASPYGVAVSKAMADLGEKDITEYLFSENSLVDDINEREQHELFLPEKWAEEFEGEFFVEYSFYADEKLSASMSVDNGNGYIPVATTSLFADTVAFERFTLPRSTKSIRFDLQNGVSINSFSITVTEAPLRPNETNAVIKDTGKDSHLIAEISCSENGLLFMPVPYDEGWEAYVDGHKTEIIRANSGFMAVDIAAGEHRVEFVYKHKLFYIGIVISLASSLIAVFFWFIDSGKLKFSGKKV